MSIDLRKSIIDLSKKAKIEIEKKGLKDTKSQVVLVLGPVNTNVIAPVTPKTSQFRREKCRLVSPISDEQRQMACFRADPKGWAYFFCILRCCSFIWNNQTALTAPKIQKKYAQQV